MAKARFVITGEVQHTGLRANLISLASERMIACKVRNFADVSKVLVELQSEDPIEIDEFYKFLKNNDIREFYKIKTDKGMHVGDIKFDDRGYVEFDWTMYYSMIQAEAALKTMAATKKILKIEGEMFKEQLTSRFKSIRSQQEDMKLLRRLGVD